MRRRARATSVLPHLSARRVVGSGVAAAVPAGGLLASAPAMAMMPAAGDVVEGVGVATASPSTPRPVLAYGSRGTAVRTVQAKVGVYVDGIFGPATAAAVKKFQSANGLVPDAIVGKLTWAAIDGGSNAAIPAASDSSKSDSAKPATSKPATSTSGDTTPSTPAAGSGASCASTTTLRWGTRSQLVKVLQGRLGVAADGIFGAATYSAVTNFQRANGLVPDGIVGKLTWAKLGCADATIPAPSTPATPKPTTPVVSTPKPATPATPATPTTPKPTTPVVSTPKPATPAPSTTPKPTTPVVSTPKPTTTAPVSTTPATSTAPSAPTTTVPTTVTADDIIAYAKQFTGTPYVWGGSTPAGFDCSGLTSYVYSHFGIKMPRTAAQQQAYFPGTTQPQPGDLLFFGYPAYHVAIYLGNGMMLDAPHPGATVGVRSIYATPTSYARVIR